MSQLKVELRKDGTVKLNAQKMKGTEAEILKELQELAREVGGELEVEKHAPGIHHHHHGDGKIHSHE